ncbi:beta-N-acetylhexosaminidase [Lacimicrobium sp. SS2-24]|uniref:beta-N-acetylhexosaminidase n=1 Tax=Lacimicrobium sp. SS2-24 TaxID=2005569 RepID=UPI000B4C0A0C|nr:beta-N-acetylhexosaminidase [Lacimicrobium sp. SS2-24]
MIKKLLYVILPLALSACGNVEQSGDRATETTTASTLNLVPLPLAVEQIPGTLTLGKTISIQTPANALHSTAALTSLLDQLAIQYNQNDNAVISLVLDPSLALSEEGYTLSIDEAVTLKAATDAGLFYAVQTLRQLLPAEARSQYTLPKVMIEDQPQYPWRGSMLDVARNFIGVDYLKAHIERMASFKLNKLHLHLTDDQGWRLQIKSWPKLTEIGGSTSVSGSNGGFYTQAQMRDIITFAQQHQVEIIPEIDLPGHTQAAIAAYNELACDDVITSPPQNQCEDVVGDARLAPYEGTCVGFSALCASQKPDLVYRFVEDVLTEVAALFPSPYLHIGGDEVLNEEADAFPEFISRVDQIVASLDRKLLAWEEASVGDIRSDALLQFWNDDYDIAPALEKGIHLVLSPCSYTYLDHGNYNGQPDTYTWCAKEGIPLERVYSLMPENYQQVVGVEAPMWSEKVASDATADNRNWPRLAAIAEVSWTPAQQRDYGAFTQRLSALRAHLDSMGIQYYRAPELGWD